MTPEEREAYCQGYADAVVHAVKRMRERCWEAYGDGLLDGIGLRRPQPRRRLRVLVRRGRRR